MAKAQEKIEPAVLPIDALAILRGLSEEGLDAQIAELQGKINALTNDMRALQTFKRSVSIRNGKFTRKPSKKKAAAERRASEDTILVDRLESHLGRYGAVGLANLAKAIGMGVDETRRALETHPETFTSQSAGLWTLKP